MRRRIKLTATNRSYAFLTRKRRKMSRQMDVFRRPDVWAFDDQDDMSKEDESPDCECRRRLRERSEAIGFLLRFGVRDKVFGFEGMRRSSSIAQW